MTFLTAAEVCSRYGLPPRQETFLARYPRRLKLRITAAVAAAIASAWLGSVLWNNFGGSDEQTETAAESPSFERATGQLHPGTEASPEAAAQPKTFSEAEAIASNDAGDAIINMVRAPDIGLVEDSAEGMLPKIGENGRKPWQVYARPFNIADKRPRVALVITGLGMSRTATDSVIHKMPSAVTLAFEAQSPVVGAWMARARQDKHETLLSVPMEPFDYPKSDPGPGSLLTNLPDDENLQRLYRSMRKGTGYVGITTSTGSRFTTNPSKLTPIIEVINQRGLLAFDTRVAPQSTFNELARRVHIPSAISTLQVDADPQPEAIDAALSQLEQTAKLTGGAIGVASPLPVTVERLALWVEQLSSRGIALAPLSAMVE